METTKKSKQEVEQQIVNYLQKTSLHLFSNDKGKLMKVIPFQSKDKWYYALVLFGATEPSFKIREVLSDSTYRYYGNNSLNLFKRSLFSKDKWHSIPNFKKSRQIMDAIKQDLKEYDGSVLTECVVQTKCTKQLVMN